MQFPQLFWEQFWAHFLNLRETNVPKPLKNEYMKASIYLRKTKKGTDDTTLCIRIRQGKSDLRAVTPLTVITHFWDCRKQCYKANTPVTTIGKDERVSFNKKVGRLLAFVEENIQEEADADALKEAIAVSLPHPKSRRPCQHKIHPMQQSWNG